MSGAVAEEVPVYFPASGDSLFGIVTEPAVPSNGIGVVLLPNRLTFHRNRVAVRLARRLAAAGFHAIRFDLHGTGESQGSRREAHLDDLDLPMLDDIRGAVRCLDERGVSRFVLVGHCSGARGVLVAGPQISGVAGIVCVALPVADSSARLAEELSLADYLRRGLRRPWLSALLDPGRRRIYLRHLRVKAGSLAGRGRSRKGAPARDWVSPNVIGPLERLVEGGVPVLFVFGTEDDYLRDFERVRSGRLGEALRTGAGLIEVSTAVEGRVHNYTAVDVQEAFLRVVEEWITSLSDPTASGVD